MSESYTLWISPDGEESLQLLSNYVGWIDAPASARRQLELYGFDLSIAHWDPCNGRWENVLACDLLADTLDDIELPWNWCFGPTVQKACELSGITGFTDDEALLPADSVLMLFRAHDAEEDLS